MALSGSQLTGFGVMGFGGQMLTIIAKTEDTVDFTGLEYKSPDARFEMKSQDARFEYKAVVSMFDYKAISDE